MNSANANALKKAAELNRKKSRRRIWHRILTVLSAFVVFVTTYILILPAITLTEEPLCGIEAHTHTDECVTLQTKTVFLCEENLHVHTEECLSEGNLICAKADFYVHTHSDICYSEDGSLLCPLAEKELHTHTDSCYEAVLPAESTTANSDTKTEEAGNTTEVTETKNNSSEESTASEAPEESSSQSSDQNEDIQKILVCGKEEIILHTHGSECYDTNNVLVCTKPEITEHIHTSECIRTEEIQSIVCPLEEHTHHEILCFSDITADVETQEEWEKTLPAELTGDYHYDLLLVAASQLGYTESSINITADADGNYTPYSRYGAASGNAYCEWQEEFVTFCLRYAGIDEEMFPYGTDAHSWAEQLKTEGFLKEDKEYTPCVGDLIFISNSGEISGVGIVSSVSDDKSRYEVIEGNTSQGKVEKILYESDSENIAGFACVGQQQFGCGLPAHIHSTSCIADNYEYSCGCEEHIHDDTCVGIYPLSEEEKKQVETVIKLIDAMPSSEEIEETLLAFENADDMDGYEAYFLKTAQQGKSAYNIYSSLSGDQKAYVKNIDKLMESSWLWSVSTFAATSAQRPDDVASVTGDGIKVQLFNYSDHINKTADHNSWRPIASYFTFRNSATTPGATPSDTTIVPSWNINSDHDIDGYTKTHATVERVLTENGTPVLDLTRNADGSARVDPGLSREIRDMAYLFSDTGDPEVSVYSPSNTFLQKDGNYYWYDSAQNAIDYDVAANVIRLRSYVERNSTTAGYTTKYGDFTPFNYTNGEQIGLNADGVTPYHIQSADVDYWFGMSMEVNFFQTKDGLLDGEEMQFHFSGDDDVWVFVDDVLVLDLGGTHGTVDGTINFSTGEVLQYLSWSGANATDDAKKNGSDTSFPTTIRACFDAAGKTPNGGWNAAGTSFADYTEHTLKIFYMERGSAVANCKLSFSLPALPENSLTVTKDLVSEEETEVTDFIKESISYKYRVMKADSEGNSTGELFIKVGAVFDILENGVKTGTGTVGADGTFSIKAGQSAQFPDMLKKGGGHVKYVVEELLPENATGQYAGVEYDISGAGGETVTDETAVNNFTAYRTGVLSAEQTQTVTFRNKLDTEKLSYLEITKEIAENAVFPNDKIFNMQVTLGDVLLPVGTKYTVGSEERTVSSEGVISLKVGETALIKEGIVAGTSYVIKELDTVQENMLATYTVSVTPSGEAQATANGVSGIVTPGTLISVCVTNQNNDFSLSIPVNKQVIDNDGTYSFSIEAEEVDPQTFEPLIDVPGAVITVTDESAVSSAIHLGYVSGTTGLKYYRIYEKVADKEFIYDDTFYILEVNTTGVSAELVSIKKNGSESIDPSSVLTFENRKTVTLNVTKDVVQKLTDESFDFTAVVTKDGEPYMLEAPSEDAGYTVDGNVIHFSLTHNSSVSIPYIPHGASISITENTTKGYMVYYSVEGIHSELMNGNNVTLNFETSDMTVHFTNDSVAELPATGSYGTFMYTLGGTLLIISAGAVLSYKVIKRRKEDFASS